MTSNFDRKHFVIYDLEATCWQDKKFRVDDMEIIEIGAVMLDAGTLLPVRDFQCFVKPLRHPDLSTFCSELTGIRQSQVEKAPVFREAMIEFSNWIGSRPVKLCSWGEFDDRMLKKECERHGTIMPESMIEHVNLKTEFAKIYGTKPSIGFQAALGRLGMEFEGRQHRGIDDARNIAKVAQQLLILDPWRNKPV